MEIVGGNEAVRTPLSAPGLDVWIDSRPHEGHVGGDIHYFSMCGSGRVTRLVLADVSGHGPVADTAAKSLRHLMRKHINQLDQTRFAQSINREFTQQADMDYFATVILMTYFAPTDHLIVCNAGHPRPIWYSAERDTWQLLDRDVEDRGAPIQSMSGTYGLKPVANLPLGIIEPTEFCQFAVQLKPDDLVLVYTDAFSEVRPDGPVPLGEKGLLELIREIGPAEPQALSDAIIDRIAALRDSPDSDDDQTLVVMRHNASAPPKMTVAQIARTMWKMMGLGRV
jgi:serine phosphatase RsbU (regulator of sigma subunit)